MSLESRPLRAIITGMCLSGLHAFGALALQSDTLDGLWRRDADGLVLQIDGISGDFINDTRPEWESGPPAFQALVPSGPGEWTAASQEQHLDTGQIYTTICTLTLQEPDAFLAVCKGRRNVYRHIYRRHEGNLGV